MSLTYVRGDATDPQGYGQKLILHICNDVNRWGAGFVNVLTARWPLPKLRYHAWAENGYKFELGRIQAVRVADEITVVNMIAQRDIRPINNIPPIRYEALRECLARVAREWYPTSVTIHMPRIGAGLAGGSWETIVGIIDAELVQRGFDVTVYDLP